MKRVFVLFLAFAILFLSSCSVVDEVNQALEDANKIERDENRKGNIGDFYLEIVDYGVDVDEYNTPVIALQILFENRSDDTANFDWVADVDVFQNGIALDFVTSDENRTTSIQSGASIKVIMVYQLRDTSDVDVEITDCMGQYDGKIKQTIKISEG